MLWPSASHTLVFFLAAAALSKPSLHNKDGTLNSAVTTPSHDTTLANTTLPISLLNSTSTVLDKIISGLNLNETSKFIPHKAPITANVSEALAAYGVSWQQFQQSSHHQGNITGLHIQGYYSLSKSLENTTCKETTYQLLDHGRFLQGNYTEGLQYGSVIGNVTAKHLSCLNSELIPSNKSLSERTLFFWASAVAFFSIIGFTANYAFTDFCSWIFGGPSGRGTYSITATKVCIDIMWTMALMATAAFFFNLGAVSAVTGTAGGTFASAANMYINGGNYYAAGTIVNNNKRYLADSVQIDWNQTTMLRHGSYDRNLTLLELAGANFTHRSMMRQELPGTNFSLPIEFWHQPHPTRPGNYTTHFGIHPSMTADQLAKRHLERRQYSQSYCPNGESMYEIQYAAAGGDSIVNCNAYDVNGESPNGGPGSYYLGFDDYNPGQVDAWEWDMGTTNMDNNGFADTVNSGVNNIWNGHGWDQCICFKENGQWLATGSFQLSWDNTYNGYSACWNANCDGA